MTLPHSLPTLRSRSPCASWAPPSIGGLCGDHSPHRTTMTQTKCCPILHFGLWWLHLPVVSPSVFFLFLRRYGRRSGQPSSSSLARRACVHYSGWMTLYCATPLVFVPFKFVYRDTLKLASAPGPFGGRGEMAMAVASSARLAFLRGAVCASMLYTRCCPFVPCTATVH